MAPLIRAERSKSGRDRRHLHSAAGTTLLGQYRLLSQLPEPEQAELDQYRQSLHLSQALGKGAYGEVWLATDEQQQQVAVKLFFSYRIGAVVGDHPVPLNSTNAQYLIRGQEKLDAASKECTVVQQILSSTEFQDPNRITRCLRNGVDATDQAFLIFEYAGSENLEDYAKRLNIRSSPKLIPIAKMILEGLRQLEGHFVHRDLKGANMVVKVTDDKPQLHFVDFGSVVADSSQHSTMDLGMTVGYMAPETTKNMHVVNRNLAWDKVSFTFTSKYDVYSAGETLFSLLCGGEKFDTFRIKVVNTWSSQSRDIRWLNRQIKIPKPEDYCLSYWDDSENIKKPQEDKLFPLIKEMLHYNPDDRKSASTLLKDLESRTLE